MNAQPALLFATDFGAAARAARVHVELLARTLSLPVRLAHVEPAHVTVEGARAHLEQLARELSSAGLSVAGAEMLSGSAAEALMHHADATRCAWIVLGARQRQVGGTVDTVTRFARQLVWVSRTPRSGPPRHVVCGIDGSAASRTAAVRAGDLCRRWGATLQLVSATEDEPSSYRERISGFVEELGLDVKATLVVERGSARESLSRAADSSRADLLVLGRVGLLGLRRTFLGGTAEHLLRHAPCSMLLTQPSEARL